MELLDELRSLVFNNNFDSESRQSVLYYEQRLREISVKENIRQHQPIQEWIKYLTDTVTSARLLLSTDRNLADRQRDELFAKIDIAQHLLDLLNINDKEKLVEEIKQALNAAKTQINS